MLGLVGKRKDEISRCWLTCYHVLSRHLGCLAFYAKNSGLYEWQKGISSSSLTTPSAAAHLSTALYVETYTVRERLQGKNWHSGVTA